MATTTYITYAQLAALMAEPSLVACIDDDGNGSASGAEQLFVTDADYGTIPRASSVMDGYLALAGYTIPLSADQVTPAMRHHVGFLAAHYTAKRRPEFRDAQGRAPYWQEAAAAEAFGESLRDRQIAQAGGPTESTATGFVTHARRSGEPVTSARNPHRSRRW